MNTLLERLAGRKKVIDKRLDNLSEALEIIGELPTETRISFSFGSSLERESDDATKYEVIQYLEDNFKEHKDYVSRIQYQSFEGRGKRKGVLTLTHHIVEAVLGGTKYIGSSFRNARAVFTISTNLGQR